MDKIWYRDVIGCLQKEGLSSKKIHADMLAALGYDVPVLLAATKWPAEFKRSRENLEDGPSSGRPSTDTNQESIDCIHQIVMDDRRLTVKHIANVMSNYQVENILKELWLQCPLCMTVDLNRVSILHTLLIWHNLIIFCFLT